MPFDDLSHARSRMNKHILMKLSRTDICKYVPKYVKRGKYNGQIYFSESRLPGVTIDEPVPELDILMQRAAGFITKFHEETYKRFIIDENWYRRLFKRDFKRLSFHFSDKYREKLNHIERVLYKAVINKEFRSVWLHGDYKIENILFDAKTHDIKGVIDWDLSRENGLPLIDILYLLFYKESLLTGKSVLKIFEDRFMHIKFRHDEQKILKRYLNQTGISEAFIIPLLVMFFINHISQRYRSNLINTDEPWLEKEVYPVINKVSVKLKNNEKLF
jgi:hypothetical protein